MNMPLELYIATINAFSNRRHHLITLWIQAQRSTPENRAFWAEELSKVNDAEAYFRKTRARLTREVA